MSTAAIDSVQASPRWPWLAEFLAGERRAWIFVGKSLLAIYLAAWLAMWLQLEQLATSMITVAIVMHPHSGMVLAKSFYRVVGTLCGSLCGLVLLSVFPQQRELFLLSLSLWVALYAGGATLYRNFMSYGFVLAGYTAAIVSLPAIGNPLHVFDSAVMRVSEVLLGIAVAAVVSDLVFPDRLRLVLRQSAHTIRAIHRFRAWQHRWQLAACADGGGAHGLGTRCGAAGGSACVGHFRRSRSARAQYAHAPAQPALHGRLGQLSVAASPDQPVAAWWPCPCGGGTDRALPTARCGADHRAGATA